jgi:hypothetical protein
MDMKCIILVLGPNMSSTRLGYYNIGPPYQMYNITDWSYRNIKYTILLFGPAI